MSARPAFVLNEHRRPRLHFDLRLEMDGVLRSWAVPKGLPTSPGQDRLAIAVPDHALADLHYSDEHKDIADIGWWEDLGSEEDKLKFVLHGRAGSVRYALFRTARDWLLHRMKDAEDQVSGLGVTAQESPRTSSPSSSHQAARSGRPS